MSRPVDTPMQLASDLPHLRRVATWMNLLFAGQRHRGITRAGLAKKHQAQGCNVSAYTSSRGTTLNVSREKIYAILRDLGVHQDGLLAPGLHRWQFPLDMSTDMRDAFADLLSLNPPLDVAVPPRWMTWAGSEIGVLLHRPARVTCVLACVPMQQMDSLLCQADLGIASERVSHGEASELQTLLSAEDPVWVVERSIDSYLSPFSPHHTLLPHAAAG